MIGIFTIISKEDLNNLIDTVECKKDLLVKVGLRPVGRNYNTLNKTLLSYNLLDKMNQQTKKKCNWHKGRLDIITKEKLTTYLCENSTFVQYTKLKNFCLNII